MQDPIAENGVVGAGGAGFPAAVKLRARAETVIVNAAECEPLLHKDKELMVHHWPAIKLGLQIAMERVKASSGVIGIKRKHQQLIDSVKSDLPSGVTLVSLRDSYPCGDEFILVYDITGQVIPPGGLPMQLGVVVSNVETLFNIGSGVPVTRKFLTVAGAVGHPMTLAVPVGTSLRLVIEQAGGATAPDFRVLVGGAMMGRLARDLDEPVTKTTGGLIVLPAEHPLARRYELSWRQVERKAQSACDQCSFCTELCPRYLLGHPLEPHRAMRSIGFRGKGPRPVNEGLYCCECNLCSLFSCPEDLDPKEVCAANKATLKKEKRVATPGPSRPHPMLDARRVPTRRLMQKLGLAGFRDEAPLSEFVPVCARVVLPMRQHIGASCIPAVQAGRRVREGEVVGTVPRGALGANIHASIDGLVKQVTETAVVIEY